MKKSRVVPFPPEQGPSRGTELKCVDSWFYTQFEGADDTSSAAQKLLPVKLINMPDQGSGVNQRIANRIRARSLQFRGFIGWNSNSYIRPQHLRFLIVYDRQTSGVKPEVSDILMDSDGIHFSQASFQNPSNRDRFLVLLDKYFVVPPSTGTSAAPSSQYVYPAPRSLVIEEEIDLHGLESHFSGSGSTMASVITGGYFVIVFGDLYLNGANAYSLFGMARLNFYD